MKRVSTKGVPVATNLVIGFCNQPDCGQPHVVLADEEGVPVAQFSMPRIHAEEFCNSWMRAFDRIGHSEH